MSIITEQCKTLAKVQLVSAYNMVGQVIKFTSESMAAFARFSSLKELSLSRLSELTDSSLRHIVELPIEKLSVGGCSGLTLDAMHHLVALRRLKDLNLYRMNIGDEGFKILTNCKTLQSLTLEGGDMTDAGLKMFSSPTSGPRLLSTCESRPFEQSPMRASLISLMASRTFKPFGLRIVESIV